MSADSGWIKRALQEYRVLLLDQRGTGRSTPVTHESLGRLAADQQADVLSAMRADNIIRDCETIRGVLLGKRKWTVLGQSFGGFCIMTYLSLAPQGLDKAILTGGLPPVYAGCSADDVYRHTYERMTARSERFYDRYPQHVKTVRDIVARLDKSPMPLPGGGILTTRRFLQLGLCLGSGSGFEHLHYLLERPWNADGQLSYEFLRRIEDETSFDTNPMYAVLHEAIYCSGKGQASQWSAQRMMPPHFDHRKALQADSQKIYLFAEHCFP
jgi:pimeloyl-ACP methyl ester carboxylesterase